VLHLASDGPGTPAALAPVSVHPSWRPAKWQDPAWKPAFSGAAVESQAAYATGDGTPVGVYVAYYRNQDYGRKLVNSENVMVRSDDDDWIVASQGVAELAFDAVPLSVKRTELRSRSVWTPDQRLTAWQFYWINGTLTVHDAHAKLYGAWHRARGRGDDAAAVVLYTQGAGPAAETQLREFLRRNLGALQAQLAATRNGTAAASP
jgi:EpsI family protein